MDRALLAYDIASIQRYVFATNHLREIRGGSALLDRVNRQLIPAAIETADPSASEVFGGGGAGLFEIDNAHARATEAAILGAVREHTAAAVVHTAVAPYRPGAPDFPEQFQRLHARLRLAKAKNPVRAGDVTHSLLQTCDTCGDGYAQHPHPDHADENVCDVCLLKLQHNRDMRRAIAHSGGKDPSHWPELWRRIASSLGGGTTLDLSTLPEDVDAICPSGEDLAIVYADGDGMGDLLDGCSSLAEVGQRSKGVEQALINAVSMAIQPIVAASKSGQLPFQILLLGGDDLILAVRATEAFALSMTLVRSFGEQVRALINQPLSLSAGLAISHPHYPIRQLADLAHGALAHAKRERFRRTRTGLGPAGGMLNFVVVGNISHTDFDDYFDAELCEGNIRRTLRPYSLAELERLLAVTRAMRALPRTKLEVLRATAFMSRNQAQLEGLGALIRLRSGLRSQVWQAWDRLGST